MTETTPRSILCRHVFGAAALTSGLIMPTWHDYNDWPQMRYIVHAATAAQIFGGTVIQFRRFAKTGASFLGALISSSPYCAYRKLSLRP
jgi:hypothetical protein